MMLGVTEGQWYSTVFHRRVAMSGGIACLLMAAVAFGAFTGRGAATSTDESRFALVWFLAWAVPGVFILTRARSAAVRVTPRAMEVRNPFRSFSLPWEEIEEFGFGWAGGLMSLGYVKPKGRRKRLLSGIRRWTWTAADPLVAELNLVLAEHVLRPSTPSRIADSSSPRSEPPHSV